MSRDGHYWEPMDPNHYRPAAHRLREQTALVPRIDKDTLQRADALFKRLNSLLD